jgi:hypothetical protein
MKNIFEMQSLEWENKVADLDRGIGFFQNTIVRTLLILGILPTLISLMLLAYFIRPTEGLLVLHYNVYFGVDLLGIWWQTYVLPLLSVIFFVGHFFLAKRFYIKTERIAAYLLLLASGMLSFGILVASVSIAFINY